MKAVTQTAEVVEAREMREDEAVAFIREYGGDCPQCGDDMDRKVFRVIRLYDNDSLKDMETCCKECAISLHQWNGRLGTQGKSIVREECATCGESDLVFEMLPDVDGRLNCHPCVELAHGGAVP